MQILCTILRIYEYVLSQHIFEVFDLVKNAKKRRGSQKERWTGETSYPRSQIRDFELEIILFVWVFDVLVDCIFMSRAKLVKRDKV